MKESISNILQHPWFTKKRKIMLGALLVFATLSSAYKWSAGSFTEGGFHGAVVEDVDGPTRYARSIRAKMKSSPKCDHIADVIDGIAWINGTSERDRFLQIEVQLQDARFLGCL